MPSPTAKPTDRPRLNPQTHLALFEPIETNYRQIDKGFAPAYQACSSDDERVELKEILSAAEDAYWAAVADALADNTEFVKRIRADLIAKNAEVRSALQGLKDIVSCLALMTEATRLAASLARLAAV